MFTSTFVNTNIRAYPGGAPSGELLYEQALSLNADGKENLAGTYTLAYFAAATVTKKNGFVMLTLESSRLERMRLARRIISHCLVSSCTDPSLGFVKNSVRGRQAFS
jgi:hypothetical protein